MFHLAFKWWSGRFNNIHFNDHSGSKSKITFKTKIETRNDPISIPTNVIHGDLSGGSFLSFILLGDKQFDDFLVTS